MSFCRFSCRLEPLNRETGSSVLQIRYTLFPFHWHSEGMSRSIQNIIPVLYTHHHFILVYIMSKQFHIKSVYVYFVF